jgi:hypothetical protein
MMKNITLAIDEDVLERARVFAERNGTTVNAMVRTHLQAVVDDHTRREAARAGLLQLIDNSTAELGPDFKWNREELYEDRLLPRHEHSDVRRSRKTG